MSSVQIYNQDNSSSLPNLSTSTLLQLSRPSNRCEFVRQGDTLHLLVYLKPEHGIPFLRVPLDSLYNAAKSFVSHEKRVC